MAGRRRWLGVGRWLSVGGDRSAAFDRALTSLTAQVGASGIVGVNVEVKNHVWGEHATEFLATGTAVRRLAAEHKLPETTPKPTFTLGLDH